MSSTNEYLEQAIRSDRKLLQSLFDELGRIAQRLGTGYDQDLTMEEQEGMVIILGDMVEAETGIELLTARLVGLEAIPRVG